MRFADRHLALVWEKVQAGERLSREDGLRLFETDDLFGLGRMADLVKSRREGDRVYFVINRYISPTNICVLSCAFCGFARKKGEDGAFEYTIEDIVGMVGKEVREVHIVGGHHPDWPFEYYERVIAALRAARPEVQIKAFTAAEIDYFWRRWKIEPKEALARLKAAGLQTMPGGGAEIFSARVARLLRYTGKADPERWCEIHGIAHSLGIKTNATMLYGHIETFAERVDHLLRLREQQDASAGFLTFIPLPYQVGTTRVCLGQRPPPTSSAPPPWRACSSTTSRTSRRTGCSSARRRRRSRSTSAPTTSTARSRTSACSTWRAPRRRPGSRASSSVA